MKRGFTLIELLVVIAIITILASITFPVFVRAREKARQAACMSNQRQIAVDVLSWAQDHDEVLPNAIGLWKDGRINPGFSSAPRSEKRSPTRTGIISIAAACRSARWNKPS